ncbi:hypothetical protein Tco_0026538 [Tanacetum coccineum]
MYEYNALVVMRAHPHRYKHPNMSLDVFREYLAEEVGVLGLDVVIDEVTPFDGRCFYEINLACIPDHVDTLARTIFTLITFKEERIGCDDSLKLVMHFHEGLEGCHLVLDVGIKLLRLGTSTSFTLTMYYSGTTGACMVRKYQYTTIDCRVSHDELAHSEHKNEK